MFGRRKKLRYVQEAELIAVKQVLEAASDMSFPGDVITPEDVERAAQMVAMQVMEGAIQGGASAADCSALMSIYTQVGQNAGSMFAPGGPMHGATSPTMEERSDT